jgi:hypothetical protein
MRHGFGVLTVAIKRLTDASVGKVEYDDRNESGEGRSDDFSGPTSR